VLHREEKTLRHETTSVVEQQWTTMAMNRKLFRRARIGSIEEACTSGVISRRFGIPQRRHDITRFEKPN